ncbi:MAG: 2Fe-2S iron-sulfur cluster binding domain-containing protein [Betaproteobacteria bacterium]|nr:2Fe-2S iron-sulfur cluster binding domain-containing protein [Betaproteobacteria bacterium]
MIRLIQRIGQNLLLRVEKGFNAIFGPELNPLYQLGAITFFLFWVVLGSGFYLYAFYRTGVSEAYSSVDKITHEQWYLGGIMRSLHRYASDGMVVLVLGHMARNFVMNRLSGFRAFSWITGIVLLLLLIISGINGYWLVWDKLAQFVAVASTEFLDWLPVFVSPLVRNFLTPDSINDRFFSLLSFAHLGIPLGMLIFIMVHTQRVSKARTQPSRQLAIGLGLTLLALALVKPALSQGGQADLSTVALQIKLDWFFMAIYPLMYTWTPGQLWALVGGFLAFLLLLPLLARTKRLKEGYQITTAPSMRTFAAKPDETVLEAALRQDVHLPYTCRDGACGNCKGTILHGAVDYGVYQHDALSEQEKQAGKALFCCAKPLSDLEIEYYENETLKQVPVKVMQCHVHNMVRATPDVMILYLKFPQGKKLQFLAGQYFDILLEDGARRSFSFANAPYDDEFIQLHVRLIPGGRFTTHVFTQMKVGDELNIEGPLGTFFLHEESDKPIIFVAGATGFAPVKSMLDQAFHTGSKRRMLLYWGVRMRKDLYMADLPERWQREHDNFTFIPVLSEASPEDNWQGRTGLVHEAILQDFPDLSGFQIYSCGSLQMVQAARPAFVAQGLPENACFSDAFLLPAPKAAQSAAEVQP